MKRALLVLLLAGLILLELWLLESLFPSNWHRPISEMFQSIFAPQPYEPHPRMELELEMLLRHHPVWRVGIYALTALLAIANGALISKVWKTLRTAQPGRPIS